MRNTHYVPVTTGVQVVVWGQIVSSAAWYSQVIVNKGGRTLRSGPWQGLWLPGLGWTTTGPSLVLLLLLMCSGSAPISQAGAPRVVVIVVWLLLFLLLECVCEVTWLRRRRLVGSVTVAIIGVVSWGGWWPLGPDSHQDEGNDHHTDNVSSRMVTNSVLIIIATFCRR